MDFSRIFIFGPPDFFRGFSRRIYFFSFLWEKCPEKSSRKIPGKILEILYPRNFIQQKSPTHFCRGARPKDFWFLKTRHFGTHLFWYPFGCLFCSTWGGIKTNGVSKWQVSWVSKTWCFGTRLFWYPFGCLQHMTSQAFETLSSTLNIMWCDVGFPYLRF